MNDLRRRVAALPGRAKAALVLAVVLSVVAVLLIALPGDGRGDDGGGAGDTAGEDGGGSAGPGGGDLTMPTTTLATGGIEVDAPEGWQAIPVADLAFGLAVPPGWEAVVLSPEALGALANADPAVPGFTESAHAAAARSAVFYAAGQNEAGAVSDLEVRAAPQTGVTDRAGLEAYAVDLAAQEGRAGAPVEVVEGAAHPTVRVRFQVGAGGEVAAGTETLVLAPSGTVWSLVVTSDDPAGHDQLAATIAASLAFATD